jgi:hypothetical protein
MEKQMQPFQLGTTAEFSLNVLNNLDELWYRSKNEIVFCCESPEHFPIESFPEMEMQDESEVCFTFFHRVHLELPILIHRSDCDHERH